MSQKKLSRMITVIILLLAALLVESAAWADNAPHHQGAQTSPSVHCALTVTVGGSLSLFDKNGEAGSRHLHPVGDWDVGVAGECELRRRFILQLELGLGGNTIPQMQLPLTAAALVRVHERLALGAGGVALFAPLEQRLAAVLAGLAFDVQLSRTVALGGVVGYTTELPHGAELAAHGAAAIIRLALGPAGNHH